MVLTECGFVHYFDRNDIYFCDPLISINLRQSELNSDLDIQDTLGITDEKINCFFELTSPSFSVSSKN
jgi:hypothetical protein